jgi:hypothetical protein
MSRDSAVKLSKLVGLPQPIFCGQCSLPTRVGRTWAAGALTYYVPRAVKISGLIVAIGVVAYYWRRSGVIQICDRCRFRFGERNLDDAMEDRRQLSSRPVRAES